MRLSALFNCSLKDLGFNPRTRVGCDKAVQADFRTEGSFNPRTRVGCDQAKIDAGANLELVAIHAPAWGATFELPLDVGIIGKFQSTHPRGVRLL